MCECKYAKIILINEEKMEVNFKRSLNLFDSTAIVIGSMIGSGIFIVSSDIARQLGSPGWLLVSWAIAGIMTVIAALSYGELAGMFPRAGGQYIYLKEAYKPVVGFLYGWTLFMVIQTGTIAAVAIAFAKFTGVLVPWISQTDILLDLGIIKINSAQIYAILMIILLTVSNQRGLKTGKLIQNIFTSSKLIIVFGLIIVGLFFVSNTEAVEVNSAVFWDAMKVENGQFIHLSGLALIAALGVSMVGSLFSSDAWNNITFTAAEVEKPKRNIPLSLFFGTLIVNIIYILVNIVYLKLLPLRGSVEGITAMERGMQFASADRVGTASMNVVLGDYSAIIMAVFIIISTFGCNNGLILAGARVYYAMAKDKVFFKSASELNKHGVPSKSLTFQAIWASLLCLSGTYSDLLDYVVFAVLLFYVLTIYGIFILRKKMPDIDRPYKAFGYPIVPAVYIVMALAIMIILFIYKPDYTWPGLLIVLLGFPVYFFWKKTKVNL